MKKIAILLCLIMSFASAAFAAKNPPQMEVATVVSQDLSANQSGYAVMPVGRGLYGAPLMRQSNEVIVETGTQRITWVESSNRHPIILPVNGRIHFYRDNQWFVVMDSKNKKHKFGLVHLEAIAAKP